MLLLSGFLPSMALAQIDKKTTRSDFPYLRREAFNEAANESVDAVDKEKLGIGKQPPLWAYHDMVMRNYLVIPYIQTPVVISQIQAQPELYGLLGENPRSYVKNYKLKHTDWKNQTYRLTTRPLRSVVW
ncbi:MAG TPA: hypothetical protein DCM08_11255 [Microscillaceae bacterium]|jgi:hypothetical protein|nr:hypothetical protein [Microscillaceae bacterium]